MRDKLTLTRSMFVSYLTCGCFTPHKNSKAEEKTRTSAVSEGENSCDEKSEAMLKSPDRPPHQRAVRTRQSRLCKNKNRKPTENRKRVYTFYINKARGQVHVSCSTSARFLQHNCRAHKYCQGAFARANLLFSQTAGQLCRSADGRHWEVTSTEGGMGGATPPVTSQL